MPIQFQALFPAVGALGLGLAGIIYLVKKYHPSHGRARRGVSRLSERVHGGSRCLPRLGRTFSERPCRPARVGRAAHFEESAVRTRTPRGTGLSRAAGFAEGTSRVRRQRPPVPVLG